MGNDNVGETFWHQHLKWTLDNEDEDDDDIDGDDDGDDDDDDDNDDDLDSYPQSRWVKVSLLVSWRSAACRRPE